jgi:hypothetical protein
MPLAMHSFFVLYVRLSGSPCEPAIDRSVFLK